MSGRKRYKLDDYAVITLLSSGSTLLGEVLSDRSHQGHKFQAFVGYLHVVKTFNIRLQTTALQHF